jgi:hypothetical protein
MEIEATMSETPPGVGRVVVLVLFTVLFAAAWRSDQTGSARLVAPLSNSDASVRPISTVALSAASIGDALRSSPAARRAFPATSSELSLHGGVGMALSRALHAQTPTGMTLGAQLSAARRAQAEAESTFAGSPALLSGTLEESIAPPEPVANYSSDPGIAPPSVIQADESAKVDTTARVVRQ